MTSYYERTIHFKNGFDDNLTSVEVKVAGCRIPDVVIALKSPDGNRFYVNLPMYDLGLTDSVINAITTTGMTMCGTSRELIYLKASDLAESIISFYKTVLGVTVNVDSISVPYIEEEDDE